MKHDVRDAKGRFVKIDGYIEKENAIHAYKAFNHNWTCRRFKYEPGKEYHIGGEIVPCNRGFHCCARLEDCFKYYNFSTSVRVAEVLIWGSIKKKGDKFAASDIFIGKELEWKDIYTKLNDGEGNTGRYNRGDCNSGDWNEGRRNVGNKNWGYNNSGSCNRGRNNSGDLNIGDCNTGPENRGNYNTGRGNIGSYNTGNYNIGNSNMGSWNKSSNCAGIFNTIKSNSLCAFNKPVKEEDLKHIRFPLFLNISLNSFVKAEFMSTNEKKENPSYKVIGGYLKANDYKEAFRKNFENLKLSSNFHWEIKLLKRLPNFDAKVFYEITGIKPDELN